MRINVGCGQSPTPGWRNFDNSLSLKLARLPVVSGLLLRSRLLGRQRSSFIDFARAHSLEYANAALRIPLDDGSVEIVYSSHMIEHLQPAGAAQFLDEAFRVLQPGGIIRLAVPDLHLLAAQYLQTGNADELIRDMQLCDQPAASLTDRLVRVLLGSRQHQWMYDGASLCKLLIAHGFDEAAVVPAGQTRIENPGALNLSERVSESVYVEAVKRVTTNGHAGPAH